MNRSHRLVVSGVLVLLVLAGCQGCGMRGLINALTPSYRVKGDPTLKPTYDLKDEARQRIPIALGVVGTDFKQVTDIQFPPGRSDVYVVLQKTGEASWVEPASGKKGLLFKLEVLTASEEGLLGWAFHPRFAENGRFFLNYVYEQDGKDISRIEEWRFPSGGDLRSAIPTAQRTVMEVQQPYPNHNAGQLQFGPDGHLYVGWGDGGLANDPHGHGQNAMTLLGDMLRIDVDQVPAGKGYGIPKDNPFVGQEGFAPEIWARGLRNPWRYSFGPQGQLIVADVGQGKWEEISVVEKGKNYGWNTREGAHCFSPEQNCATEGLEDPIYEYGHDEGISITGGYVYTGSELPELKNKYLFGDFVMGRLWALDSPTAGKRVADVATLGRWPILPSTFGRDANGEVYVGDFDSGRIFRIVRAEPQSAAPGAGTP